MQTPESQLPLDTIMETILTISEPIHIHRLELFMNNVIATIKEKNDFVRFFPRDKLNKIQIPTDQQLVLEIATIVVENRRLERTFQINIFDKTLFHFSVKLRQVRTGYVLTLDWNNK